MGNYRSRQPSGPNPKNTVNPYMRGIGCLFIAIVPVFSYFVGAALAPIPFVRQIFPPEWYGAWSLSPKLTQLSGFSAISAWLSTSGITLAALVTAVIVAIVVGGIISVVFGYLYQMLSPAKYGGMDVPPPRVKTKKYKR